MPSDDAKPLKKETAAAAAAAVKKSLSSVLEARKKNPTDVGTLTTKSRPKGAKVKREDDEDDEHEDFNVPDKGDSRAVLSTDSNQAQPRKVKKEKNVGDEEDDDDVRLTKRSSATEDSKELNRKKKKQKEEEKKKVSMVANELNGKDNRKREKKVYDLPGQKRDTPEERDPLRIFYETLYKHVPNSEMAQIWMMESGLLPREEAKILHEKRRKNDQNKLSSPLKAITLT